MKGVTVLVYSDASHKESGGAWGAVIVRPGAEIAEASGKLRGVIPSSTHAELMAAANAIAAGIARELIKPGDRVVVRCDNLNAVHRITGKAKVGKRKRSRALAVELAAIADWFFMTTRDRGIEITAKWVKGHVAEAKANPHELHNRRADRLCAYVMGTRLTPEEAAAKVKVHAARQSQAARTRNAQEASIERKAKLAAGVEMAKRLECGA